MPYLLVDLNYYLVVKTTAPYEKEEDIHSVYSASISK